MERDEEEGDKWRGIDGRRGSDDLYELIGKQRERGQRMNMEQCMGVGGILRWGERANWRPVDEQCEPMATDPNYLTRE